MRISTLLIAAVAALAAFSGAVISQHGGDMSEHFAMVAKHLNLTPSQEKQLKAEHQAAQKKVAAIDADSKLDKAAKDKAKAKLHNDMMAKAKTILTPAQIKEMTLLFAMMGHQQQMMQMMEKIGLSSEQKTAVSKLISDTTSAMQIIHHDSKLTDAQREAKAKELHNATMEKIHGILTPEQIEKAKALHHGTGHGG